MNGLYCRRRPSRRAQERAPQGDGLREPRRLKRSAPRTSSAMAAAADIGHTHQLRDHAHQLAAATAAEHTHEISAPHAAEIHAAGAHAVALGHITAADAAGDSAAAHHAAKTTAKTTAKAPAA